MIDEDALDGALARLAGAGPEHDGGLSNHGPMAADALVRLGRGDTVSAWIGRYVERLEECPTFHGHAKVLGDPSTFVEWRESFQRRIGQHGAEALLAAVLPTLLPGVIAAAFHGPIRVAHAVRSLWARDTTARRDELASALAYWACRYEPLGARPQVGGRGAPERLLRELPDVPADRAWLIAERARRVKDVPAFFAAIDGVDLPEGPVAALWRLSAVGRDLYLAHREHAPIVYVHAVTGPQAVADLVRFLSDEDADAAVAWTWQALAALVATHRGREVSELPTEGFEWADAITAAVDSWDEHAIKLALACKRGHAREGDPRWLLAVSDAARRLGGSD